LGALCNTSLKGFLPRRRAALGGRAKPGHGECLDFGRSEMAAVTFAYLKREPGL